MEGLNYWNMCGSFTLVHAAILIVGENPSHFQGCSSNDGAFRDIPDFFAAFTAMKHAIARGHLNAEIVYYEQHFGHGDGIDWDNTTVDRPDLETWLQTGNSKYHFFPPKKDRHEDERSFKPRYLNADGEHYSPKLAAAINAWEFVSENLTSYHGKTVKQSLQKWLTDHADEYGLMNDDGNVNRNGIKEIAKIANWAVKGGAPKTPF